MGHLALIDHVFSNTNRVSTSPENLNAVALIAIPHNEWWIERKLYRSRQGQTRSNGADLHLKLKQRYELLNDGIPIETKRDGVWVFPGKPEDWWRFQGRMKSLCERDGFEIEFVELLGPDYVSKTQPQCSGVHGVVTSNVCRKADFVADSVANGTELLRLRGFGAWEKLANPSADKAREESMPDEIEAQKHRGSSVSVCRHNNNLEYKIWFVHCREPTLDPDMSSTDLRRAMAEADAQDLEEKARGTAMSPELLARFVKEYRGAER